MLSEIKNADIHIGVKQSKKALEEGRVSKAIVEEDADPHVTEPFAAACKKKGVEVCYTPSMEKLGHAAGIDVGAAIVVLLKQA